MTQSPPPQSPQAQSPPARSPPAENTLEVDVSIWTLLRYEGYPTDIIGFVQEAPPDDNESAYNESWEDSGAQATTLQLLSNNQL